MTKMRSTKPVLFALLALAGVATASTFSDYLSELSDWEDIGYEEAYNDVSGNLREGQTASWTFRAFGGERYLNFAVCDEDCGDLDLYLYDQSGRLVAKDTDMDYTPFVAWNIPFTQTMKVVVKMEDCGYNPCEYRLGFLY
ncbi:hypothetical protein [Deinococcus ficus]|uniref:hypothetical protein n=1 Tax=Deinococcus ficus TaxID=317577 RepID=UPI0003B779CD|nr:hypothetical protein [Deinococcus ficus]